MARYVCPKCAKQFNSSTPSPRCRQCGVVASAVESHVRAHESGSNREKRVARNRGRRVPPRDRSAGAPPRLGQSGRAASLAVASTSTATPAASVGISYGDHLDCHSCDTKNSGRDEEFDHMPPLPSCEQTATICRLICEQIPSDLGEEEEEAEEGAAAATGPARRHGLKPGNRGYMVGVLIVRGFGFVAMSGESTLSDFPAIVAAVARSPECPVPRLFVCDDASRVTAGGAAIGDHWMAHINREAPAPPFQCAAPKIVSAAIDFLKRNGDGGFAELCKVDWTMTEMWVGPRQGIRRPGVIQPSCGNCEQVLPMQLCGLDVLSNTTVDSDGEEWTTAESSATRRRRRQGLGAGAGAGAAGSSKSSGSRGGSGRRGAGGRGRRK